MAGWEDVVRDKDFWALPDDQKREALARLGAPEGFINEALPATGKPATAAAGETSVASVADEDPYSLKTQGPVERFARGFVRTVDPRPLIGAMGEMVAYEMQPSRPEAGAQERILDLISTPVSPIRTHLNVGAAEAKRIGGALSRAAEAAKGGNFAGTSRAALESVPVFGGQLEDLLSRLEAGDIAGAAGEAVGFATPWSRLFKLGQTSRLGSGIAKRLEESAGKSIVQAVGGTKVAPGVKKRILENPTEYDLPIGGRRTIERKLRSRVEANKEAAESLAPTATGQTDPIAMGKKYQEQMPGQTQSYTEAYVPGGGRVQLGSEITTTSTGDPAKRAAWKAEMRQLEQLGNAPVVQIEKKGPRAGQIKVDKKGNPVIRMEPRPIPDPQGYKHYQELRDVQRRAGGFTTDEPTALTVDVKGKAADLWGAELGPRNEKLWKVNKEMANDLDMLLAREASDIKGAGAGSWRERLASLGGRSLAPATLGSLLGVGASGGSMLMAPIGAGIGLGVYHAWESPIVQSLSAAGKKRLAREILNGTISDAQTLIGRAVVATNAAQKGRDEHDND